MEEDICTRAHKTNEVYSMSYSSKHNTLLSGGGDNALSFHAFHNDALQIDEVIEGLDDSVVFVSFTRNSYAVGITMDGTVVYVFLEQKEGRLHKSVELLHLCIDVTSVSIDKDKEYVYMGSSSGTAHRVESVPADTQDRKVYAGHKSGIIYSAPVDNLIFTVSGTHVLVHQLTTQRLVGKYKAEENNAEIIAAEAHPKGSLLSLGFSNGTLVLLSLSSTHHLAEVYRYSTSTPGVGPIRHCSPPESVAYVDDHLLFSVGNKIVCLDIKSKRERAVIIPEEEFLCVVKIVPVSSSFSLVLTNTGTLYLVDARNQRAPIVTQYPVEKVSLDALLSGRSVFIGTVDGVVHVDLSK